VKAMIKIFELEKEYMETIPFTITSKKIKYLEVNLTNDELQTPEE
jgi:hypothetical protein